MANKKERSHLVRRMPKADERKMLSMLPQAIIEGVDGLRDPEVVKRIEEAEAARFGLPNLLADVENLLADVGAPVPKTPSDLDDEINRRRGITAMEDHIGEARDGLSLLLSGKGSNLGGSDLRDLSNSVARVVGEMLAGQSKPDVLALEAYRSLKAAEEVIASTQELREGLQQDVRRLAKECPGSPQLAFGNGCLKAMNDLVVAVHYVANAAIDIARASRHYGNLERSEGGRVKAASDPKAAAKKAALELWKERNAGKHPNLRRVQDFATEVMRRWPVLANAKTIEGWSAKWTKQVKSGEAPTC